VTGWYRARRKSRAARKNQKALDRLHGHGAVSRRRGGGGGSSGDWGDVLGDVFSGLIEALFKIFD
jgi:hypothetical protein